MRTYRIHPERILDINTPAKEVEKIFKAIEDRKKAVKELRSIARRAELFGWTRYDITLELKKYIEEGSEGRECQD